MINWFDMPAEGLSNGGLFEIKELTATENKVYEKAGEVYNKVTVNVEGGGGGDFSTAEVTVICNVESAGIDDGWWIVDNMTETHVDISEGTTNLEIVLYKGENRCGVSGGTVSVSGDATATSTPFGSVNVTITGDCTITIS